MNDFKFAVRQLLKNPGFTAVAVLTPVVRFANRVSTHTFLKGLAARIRLVKLKGALK